MEGILCMYAFISLSEVLLHSSEMELSPAQSEQGAEGDSFLSIARRIAKGLHPCMVYSDTDYLNTVKAELRKLLKQGSAVGGVVSVGAHSVYTTWWLASVLICCIYFCRLHFLYFAHISIIITMCVLSNCKRIA